MPHQTVAHAESSTARHRPRLTREGTAFLLNYVQTITAYPKKSEKESILQTLRIIPGNEAFTLDRLNTWFSRHRKLSRDQSGPVCIDDETILFPKLTPTQMQQLRVLYKKRPDPSEGIISFWADRLHSDREEVAAFIRYQQEKAREDDAGRDSPDLPLREQVGSVDSTSISPTSELPRPHLPTPAMSLSPSISPRTKVPSLPPIAVKLEERRQCMSPVSSLSSPCVLQPLGSCMPLNEPHSALDGLPPLSKVPPAPVPQAVPSLIAVSATNDLLHTGRQASRRDANTMLAAMIRESLQRNATPSAQPPRTVDEFAEQFQEVENMINAFITKYESGHLARLGWDADLGQVTL